MYRLVLDIGHVDLDLMLSFWQITCQEPVGICKQHDVFMCVALDAGYMAIKHRTKTLQTREYSLQQIGLFIG